MNVKGNIELHDCDMPFINVTHITMAVINALNFNFQ